MNKKFILVICYFVLFVGCKTVKTNKLTVDSTSISKTNTIAEEKNNTTTSIVVVDSVSNKDFIRTIVYELDTFGKSPLVSLPNLLVPVPLKKITQIETFRNQQQKVSSTINAVQNSAKKTETTANNKTETKRKELQKKTTSSNVYLKAFFVFIGIVISLVVYLFFNQLKIKR